MSRASVTASFPATNARARNGESSANSCENFTFHGHTLWEMCRYTRFEIPLETGWQTVAWRDHERTDCLADRHTKPRPRDRAAARLAGAGLDSSGCQFKIHET